MKIAFLGDIALIGKYNLNNNPNVRDEIEYLKKILKNYDYRVANLESPLTERKSTFVCKSMHLKSSVVNVGVLKYLGIDAVTLANNHIMDFGRKGLEETINVLENAKIKWYGIDGKELLIEKQGQKISFSGFCCYSTNGTGYCKTNNGKGINLLTEESVFCQLKKDEKRNAFSVLSIHWGMEHTNYPAYEHICLVKKIAMKKPVIIHGHHPHVIQGISNINNSLIMYSQGNALFDDCKSINGKFEVALNENNRKSFVMEVTIDHNKIQDYKEIGFYMGDIEIEPYNIQEELLEASKKIQDIKNIGQYERLRKEQFQKVINEKFGKHNIQWLISKMNYYAIGAKIQTYFRERMYKKEVKKFIRK